jgi:hypothetical protein
LGWINASFPFATLEVESDTLRLACFGRDYAFAKSKITRLRRHRGLFSVGLRIVHSEETAPETVIFWAAMVFWPAPFERLQAALAERGFAVD